MDLHALTCLEETAFYKIRFHESLLLPEVKTLIQTLCGGIHAVLSPQELSFFMQTANILIAEQFAQPTFYRHRARYLISDCILCLLRKNNTADSRRVSDTARTAVGEISKRFRENITLSSLAAELCISPDHLGRLFKQYTGISFSEYRNTLRLRCACDLLKNTSRTVKEIAFDCGYHSEQYFIHTFKNHYGSTPHQWRCTSV